MLEDRLSEAFAKIAIFVFNFFISFPTGQKRIESAWGSVSAVRETNWWILRAAQQTSKQMSAEKNLFNSTLGSSKTMYNIFDRNNEKARIVQRKTQKHTRQSKVFNLFYRFIGRNVRMFPKISSDNRLKSATTVMRVCINYEVAIIWRFKSVCISRLKKAPDHWFHVILIARSVSCPLLSKNRVFIIVFTSEVVSTPSKSLNLNQFKEHIENFDCLSSGLSHYLTRVGYNIHLCKLQSVLSRCVFTAQVSYVPCTFYVCQNLYRTSVFSLVNQKNIKPFD